MKRKYLSLAIGCVLVAPALPTQWCRRSRSG